MAEHAHITPAPGVTTTARRNLFTCAAAVALLVAPAALALPPAPSELDAELIALCRTFADGCKTYDTVWDTIADDAEANQRTAAIVAAWPGQLDQMERLQARTAAGIQARAYALHAHAGHGECSFDHPATHTGRLLAYVMRDAAALGDVV